MSHLTLPGLARKRRDLRAEPTFDDLIAGNKREPSHADLLTDDEDDQTLKPAARELPIVYPGVSTEVLAWLHEHDRHEEHNGRDEHAFDVDRLIPATPLRRTVELTQLTDEAQPTATAVEEPPTMPAGNPRLLFDALDALDRLPGLYAVDAASFEFAANIAAIQTYAALQPHLLGQHEVRMQLAPLAAELAEVAL